MSTQVTVSFVKQFEGNVMHLAQQGRSKLDGKVMTDSFAAETKSYERIGATEMQEKNVRHGDTPIMDTPHSRRVLTAVPYEWADLVDKEDDVQMLISPTSEYAMAAAKAAGRKIDDVIIAAANGNAKTGKDGTALVPLPTSQTIAAGGGGMTLAKLIEASEKFNLADIDPDEPKCMVIGPKQVSNMLNIPELTSQDFTQLRALWDGKFVHYMGFDFVMSNRLALSGSDRQCLAFTRQGIKYGIRSNQRTRITERSDKSYATQVYLSLDIGAVRMEEVQVVQIDCQE